MNERVIFEAALNIADPQARRAYLDQACAGQPELRARVEALLKSHADAGSFLEVPVVPPPPPGTPPKTVVVSSSKQDADDDDSDGGPPDLSFLQPSAQPGAIGMLGHYHILEILGHGSFGIVFKAFDDVLHRHVAIKVMNPQLASTSPPRKRFLREARAAAAIRHDNVVQVHSVEEQPLPYLVMEYIQGQTLQQKLDAQGPLELPEILHLARQIASGLAAAHALGLIHRDIKPGNILIEQGAEQRVKITDFGLARTADDASLTKTGVISGTPNYMAPEQAQGQPVDHRSDLFSLGSVIYVMACGRLPFRAGTMMAVLKRVIDETPRPLREIIPEIPAWLAAIVKKLHEKQAEDRFDSAKDVADLLARCLADVQANRLVELPAEMEAEEKIAATAERAGPRSASEMSGPLAPASGERVRERGEQRTRVQLWPTIAVVGLLGVGLFGWLTMSTKKPSSSVPEVAEKSDPQPSTLDPKPSDDPDRRAAEWVLSVGGSVYVNNEELKDDTTYKLEIRDVSALPSEAFRLTFIHLDGKPNVTDKALACFLNCRSLEELWLGRLPEVTDAGLASFANCIKLRVLTLNGVPVTDDGLASFQNLKELSYLRLQESKVTEKGLAYFENCTNLTKLDLSAMQINDRGLACFRNCKKLQWLDMGDTTGWTDAGLMILDGLTELQHLILSDTAVTNDNLAHLQDCRRLTTLELRNTLVSDAGLVHIASLPRQNQFHLHLENTRVSQEGHDQLQTARPDVEIFWSEPNRIVVQQVLALGGQVEIGTPGEAESRPVADVAELPDEYFQVRRISLAGVEKLPDDLPGKISWLKYPQFDRLESLDLSGIAGLTYDFLTTVHGLRELIVANAGLTDVKLAQLPKLPTLKRLVLDGNDLKGPGLASLKEQPALVDLSLKQTKVTAAKIDELKQALPKCRIEWDGGVIEPRESSDGWHGWPADAPKPAIARSTPRRRSSIRKRGPSTSACRSSTRIPSA